MKLFQMIALALCFHTPLALCFHTLPSCASPSPFSKTSACAPAVNSTFTAAYEKQIENGCDIMINLTVTAAATTMLSAYIINQEYKQHGSSSKCTVLTGTLAVVTFMTGAMAYIVNSVCYQ